jgi:hypothetical protein
MDTKTLVMEDGGNRYESDFAHERKSAETQDFSHVPLGQNCPQHCPHLEKTTSSSQPGSEPLGQPLMIEDVAVLLGCSPWTVRQRYLRQGLPYLQARPRGKLVFFREQVIAWIEKRQRQKGGIYR